MNLRPNTGITLALLGTLGALLLVWQILAGPIGPLGAGGEALAADVGIMIFATPSATATAGASQLTVTATATSPAGTATSTVTPTTEAPTATVTATATVTTGQVITVTSFFIDVSATTGGSTVSLGRAIEVQNFVLRAGQPLPSGKVFFSGPVAGTTFDAALKLEVTSLEPLTLAVQQFEIVLDTAPPLAADVSNIGTVVATVPGTTPIDLSASQDVTGLGPVTFEFTGQIVTTVP